MGSTYGKIVRQCLRCDFGYGDDLDDLDLQARYYQAIVCELRRLEDGFGQLLEWSSGPTFHYGLKRLLISVMFSMQRVAMERVRGGSIVEQKWRMCSLLHNCTAPSDIERTIFAPQAHNCCIPPWTHPSRASKSLLKATETTVPGITATTRSLILFSHSKYPKLTLLYWRPKTRNRATGTIRALISACQRDE